MADLEELAARGKRRKRADVDASVRKRIADDRRDVERAECGATPLGILRTYVGGLGVAMTTLLASGFLVIPPAVRAVDPSGLEIVVRMLAPIAIATGAVLAARRFAAERGRTAYDEATAWVAALPFELDGFEALMRSDPNKFVIFTVHTRERASLDAIATAALGLDSHITGAAERNGTLVMSWWVAKHAGAAGPATNYPAFVAVRRTIDELLVPLHAREPIARVEIEYASGARA